MSDEQNTDGPAADYFGRCVGDRDLLDFLWINQISKHLRRDYPRTQFVFYKKEL
jgi:hypothetical protein